ncbi:MAG TPA: Rieske 2Fe-2S domain-containing protein [Dictyobacter sp.]|jgi:nitrite reductase/ring-hydroxylating ferredoxin subunit|nr:Rieske 2Fe-2S domain-containing protein [Dictyobacter sp.]
MAEGFVEVAHLHEISEGKLHSVEVDGESVCLVKVDGQVCAFTNNCTHISGPLDEGAFDGQVVTCPWHGSQFDVRTGQVKRGPAKYELYTYPVRVDGDSVAIYLPPEE